MHMQGEMNGSRRDYRGDYRGNIGGPQRGQEDERWAQSEGRGRMGDQVGFFRNYDNNREYNGYFRGPDGHHMMEPNQGGMGRAPTEEERMSRGSQGRRDVDHGQGIVKVIEILAESSQSWEDAAQRAVYEASRTIRGIRSVYIKDMQAIVQNSRIVSYRVNAKISFSIDHGGYGER